MLPAQVCVPWQEQAATTASRWDCPQGTASPESRWLRIPSWPPVARDGLAGGAKPAALSQRFLEAHMQLHKRENKWELAWGLHFARLFAFIFQCHRTLRTTSPDGQTSFQLSSEGGL